MHVIPRYQEERMFDGVRFKDELWGQNYAKYPKGEKLTQEQLHHLRDALQHALRH